VAVQYAEIQLMRLLTWRPPPGFSTCHPVAVFDESRRSCRWHSRLIALVNEDGQDRSRISGTRARQLVEFFFCQRRLQMRRVDPV